MSHGISRLPDITFWIRQIPTGPKEKVPALNNNNQFK